MPSKAPIPVVVRGGGYQNDLRATPRRVHKLAPSVAVTLGFRTRLTCRCPR